jgi:hypothetical protein
MQTGMRAGHRPTGGEGGGACQARKWLLIRTSAAREWLEAGWLQSGGRWLTAAFDCAALDEWSVGLDEWSVRTVYKYTK